MPPASSSFLPHVAGLRAIAIILVVLFHLDGSAWAHGYLGVDVFLVISGYMLFRSRLRQSEPYGIKDSTVFLYKRFLRIVPPMAVTILLTIAMGILLMGAEDLAFLCGLSGYSLVGAANFWLRWSFEDYFAQDAAFIPLLHFWYLAVILQVYLLWAAGNYLIQRLPKGMLIAVLVALGLASLAYCYSFSLHEWLKGMGISWWEQDKAPSYYQTLPRVWEILAGGLICVLPSVRKRTVAAVLSLLGLLCILMFSLNSSIPGGGISWVSELPATLFVVGCTILLIRYLPESGLNKLLANAPLVWLGGISFSIYLVHLPIIVYCRIWNYGKIEIYDILILLTSILVLGWIIRQTIEQKKFSWWCILGIWIATMMVCKIGRNTGGYGSFLKGGYSAATPYENWRWNNNMSLENGLSPSVLPSHHIIFWTINQPLPEPVPKCRLMIMGNSEKTPDTVLMGDSHAASFYAGFDSVFKEEKISALYLSAVSFPFHNYKHTNLNDPSYCNSLEKENSVIAWLTNHSEIKNIIISFYWTNRYEKILSSGGNIENKLRHYLLRLQAIGKNVVLIGPAPEFPEEALPKHYYKIAYIKGQKMQSIFDSCTHEKYIKRNKYMINCLKRMQSEGLCTYIELEKIFPFPIYLGEEQTMLDTHHLSPAGSIWVARQILPQIKNAIIR